MKASTITKTKNNSGFSGFIDLHTHGIGGYDTRTSDHEEILKIAELHGNAGTAAILPTIYSGSIAEMRKNMEAVKKAIQLQKSNPPHAPLLKGGKGGLFSKEGQGAKQARSSGYDPWEFGVRCKIASRFTLHASRILGVHIEGPFLNPLRCGALDKTSFIKPDIPKLKRLLDGYEDITKIITIAPEMPGALKVIERCRDMGIRINMGHSDATYNQALKGKKAGATGITHIFNAMRPFHHREPGIAGFGLLDEDIYIEAIADGIHLRPETLKLIFSFKRHDRIMLVSDSVKGAQDNRKAVYRSKGVLAGSSITIRKSVELLKNLGMPINEILAAAVKNPARYLSMSSWR